MKIHVGFGAGGGQGESDKAGSGFGGGGWADGNAFAEGQITQQEATNWLSQARRAPFNFANLQIWLSSITFTIAAFKSWIRTDDEPQPNETNA